MRFFLTPFRFVLCVIIISELIICTRATTSDTGNNAGTSTKAAEKPVNFRAMTLTGKLVNISFKNYAGKPVVLYFWNLNWFPQDMTELLKAAKKHPDITFLTVHMTAKDINGGQIEVITKLFKAEASSNVKFLMVDDAIYAGAGYLVTYRAHVFPTILFINRAGKINAMRSGPFYSNGHQMWDGQFVHAQLNELKQ